MIKPKEAQVIVYTHKQMIIKGILIPEIKNGESVLIVRFRGKLYFIHTIGEKLGPGHKIGYYCTPNHLPLPQTKNDYKVVDKMKIESSDTLEEVLLLASHQPGFDQMKRFFGKLLP